MLQLLFYFMIGILYSVYKIDELKRYEIILFTIFWPVVMLFNFIKLVDAVKENGGKPEE